ncbi:BamA/TamA family outer membrane protein [Sphingomonas daechungensis]|uniref:BamA/TamA family outer membrane protein n=1 Tax=Sphingomonas daechungensis TaxID=1176646 RepID=UPI0021D52FA1|nr:BamA/TamA family outer membrane protein [Sphingomonas daechungensis]
MRGSSWTRAPTGRFRTVSCWPAESGLGRSSGLSRRKLLPPGVSTQGRRLRPRVWLPAPGPRDAFDDPIGGSGLAEFALEARIRLKAFGGNFGVVPFLDGGTLTTDAMPDLNSWQLGAGVGLRYYSAFGPIRIDVGTPLNPRANDSRIAVVVSLGQAF